MSSVGPVPMPVVLILACVLLAMAVARLWSRRKDGMPLPSAPSMVLDMLLVGLLCGRISFVALNFTLYREAPWGILQIADGGYHLVIVWLRDWHGGCGDYVRGGRYACPCWARRWQGCCCGRVAANCCPHGRRGRCPCQQCRLLTGGGRVDLQQFRGKPLVLNLWASWCGPCRREMPVLAAAQEAHAEVQFVFLNQGETLDEVQGFVARERLMLDNVLLDGDAAASTALGVQAYPSTLFFDAEGRLRELHLGELTAAGLEHKLRRLR